MSSPANTTAPPAPPAASEDDRLWTVRDVARFLSMSPSWVYQASAGGTLPCLRIGAAVRFDPATIRAWVRGEAPAKVVQLRGCR